MDRFDKISSYLWQFKRASVTGLMWCPEWTTSKDGIIKEKGTPISGHAFIFIGRKMIDGEPYLVAQLSNGTNIGDKGKFYFKREIVNEMCTFGNFAFIDYPPELLKILHTYNLSLRWIWLARILNYLDMK